MRKLTDSLPSFPFINRTERTNKRDTFDNYIFFFFVAVISSFYFRFSDSIYLIRLPCGDSKVLKLEYLYTIRVCVINFRNCRFPLYRIYAFHCWLVTISPSFTPLASDLFVVNGDLTRKPLKRNEMFWISNYSSGLSWG